MLVCGFGGVVFMCVFGPILAAFFTQVGVSSSTSATSSSEA
jgi:hypothetical protein